ncbi:integrase arm-type DNA-binding domain-containing protein [Acidithiobacillus caldus]|uniref:tyrosine-type recombinase/integrase n=1 Tax=Acidithiobacillus caldus TaxID=33059 RepID=UPI001C07B517|nr:site-specific integrase [Acidithiobacillus caldus]MBU2801055.1 integrase arm-type DNA-binding domain-containing protein [Acidithiobacillus caldus]
MAQIHKLTARKVETAAPGTYPDGGNLYLRVRSTGSRAWVFRYVTNGKAREIGMGSLDVLSLAEARNKAEAMRKAVAAGTDPVHVIRPPEKRKPRTFQEVAHETIEALRPGWRNTKHAQQWANTLRVYAFPVFGAKPVADVTVDDVLKALSPIWTTKTETATRLRQRIEAVLDRAAALGDRDRDRINPATWKGNLEHLLPKAQKVKKRQHFAALPYSQLPGLMAALRKKQTVGALCLRVIVLTSCRSNEIRGLQWGEIDMAAKTLTIPPSRTKTGKAHVVPMSAEVVEIIERMAALGTEGTVFPNNKGRPLSDVAVTKALRQFHPTATVHGMRSAFRDWAGDKTHHARETIESCLAHALDSVEAAYRRGDAIEKRRAVMDDWARFLGDRKGNVIPLTA